MTFGSFELHQSLQLTLALLLVLFLALLLLLLLVLLLLLPPLLVLLLFLLRLLLLPPLLLFSRLLLSLCFSSSPPLLLLLLLLHPLPLLLDPTMTIITIIMPYYIGSVVGCSMDMWCPYGLGREISDWVVRKLVDPDPSP